MKEKTDKLDEVLKYGELRHITYMDYVKLLGDKVELHVRKHCRNGGELYYFKFSPDIVPYTELRYLLHLYRITRLSSFIEKIYEMIINAKLRMADNRIRNIKTV